MIETDTADFEKELEHLINKHCIENMLDMPDFIIAEMIVKFLRAVGPSVKKNLDWHGCDSVCHPRREPEIIDNDQPTKE